MRGALKFAYDGEPFYGYARQPKLKTVEGEIVHSLTNHGFIKNAKESIFRSASRTDKGVSSLGSIVAFNTNKSIDNILEEINKNSKELVYYAMKKVDDDFYPRYAKQRIYRYYLKNNDFNVEKIISAASIFTGTHNFSNFARVEEGKNPERTIDNIIVGENDQFFTIDFYAQTFLWHQIRRIISSMMKVAIGKISQQEIINALVRPEERVDFGLVDSASLILKDVLYEFTFMKHPKWEKKKDEMEDQLIHRIKYLS